MRTLIAATVLVSASMAQTFIPLNGQVFDGNGGPLLSGQVYHIVSTGGGCGISVPSGQTLTIQPGAIIKVGGCFLISGTVNAIGTPTSRITITSIHDDNAGGDTNGNGALTFPQRGDWDQIDCGGAGSRFEWCDFSYGGNNNRSCLGLRLQPHEFHDCRFRELAGDGVDSAWWTTIQRCDFEDLGGVPVRDLQLPTLANFLDNTARGCDGGEWVGMVGGRNFAGNLTMDPRMSINGNQVWVYDMSNSTSPRIPAGTHWTLPAGTVFKFRAGQITSLGQLVTQGTPANPVVLTSIEDDTFGGDTEKDGAATSPAPGQWIGVDLQGGDTSDLVHTLVRYAGRGSPGAIHASGSAARLSFVTIEESQSDGLEVRNPGLSAVEDCVFLNNGDLPIRNITWNDLTKCVRNVTQGNASGDHYVVAPERPSTAIEIAPGNFPGDVLEVTNKTNFNNGGSLSIPAGTILKFQSRSASGFSLSNSSVGLYLNGTARRPVVLTTIKDDVYGGDTNGDGNATTPAPNDFGRIFASNSSDVQLQNVLLRFGTSNTLDFSSNVAQLRNVRVEHTQGDAIQLNGGGADVTNLVVYDCSGDGLKLRGGSFDVVHATVANCGGAGIVATGPWTGSLVNSISWGNSGSNIGLSVAQVFDTNGVEPPDVGINGNDRIDPLFVDAPNGDLTLQTVSPSRGAADRAAAIAVGGDHDEYPRVLDDALNGSWQADQGAYERSAYSMTVAGDAVLGGTLIFGIQGPPGIGGFFLGAGGPPIPVPGLGIALTGPADTIGTFVPVGGSIQLNVPNDPGLVGGGFAVQGAGLQVVGGTLRGGLTNVERGIVRP